MNNAILQVPPPENEPIYSYGPGTPEKADLKAELKRMAAEEIEIPLIIGGKEVKTGNMGDCRMPHDHAHVLGRYHKAGAGEVSQAAEAAAEAWKEWSTMPWNARAAVMLKAAELLTGPYRQVLNASTMLGQSKNPFQAEVDAACELIDFWRFNPWYMQEIYEGQPPFSLDGAWNCLEHRPLEGFVFAVTPFNFTSIAGNLPTAPALMGNTVLWKPASSSVHSAYYIMKLLQEAGMPDGVINLIPGPGGTVGDPVMAHPDLAGVHFTGSTEVFQGMWKTVGDNISKYHTYPRIVGETGGKDFIFAHPSADLDALVTATVRGAFEYQGQKCSAVSRVYIPQSLWPEYKDGLLGQIGQIKMGDVQDFTNFMNAVIDAAAFKSISGYIDHAKSDPDSEIITGGGCDDSKGYFIEPTVIVAKQPHTKTMEEEIFGPVVTLYIYPDAEFSETLKVCDNTSPYALTGAIFSQDRKAILEATSALTHAAGNFYINDKPTGAVVGQQPFGGSRASGTNDKAGSATNLLRWISQRTIKENFIPPKDFRYPFLAEE